MRRPRVLLLSMISALLIAIMAIGLWLDTRSSSAVTRAPIPASVLAAYQPGKPITNPTQAFVAAQFYLGTTRLRAAGEILPYSAEYVRYSEAITRTAKPGEVVDPYSVRHGDVWLVLLEGAWTIEPPVPDSTPGAPQPGCVHVILNAEDGEQMEAGGIRPCGEYQVRPAGQIIQELFRLNGISARPAPVPTVT